MFYKEDELNLYYIFESLKPECSALCYLRHPHFSVCAKIWPFCGVPNLLHIFLLFKKVLLFVDRVAQFFYFVFSIRDSVFSFIRSTCKSFLTGLTGYFLLSLFQLEFSLIFLSLYWIHFLIPWIAFVILFNFCLCFLELNLNFIPSSGCLCSL